MKKHLLLYCLLLTCSLVAIPWAKVGDVTITREQVMEEKGDRDLSAATVLDSLIDREIMRQYGERNNVTISDDELYAYCRAQLGDSEYFKVNGQWSDAQYYAVMAKPNGQRLKAVMEKDLRQNKITRLLTGDQDPDENQLLAAYVADNAQVDLTYALVTLKDAPEGFTWHKAKAVWDSLQKQDKKALQAKVYFYSFPVKPGEDSLSIMTKLRDIHRKWDDNRLAGIMETPWFNLADGFGVFQYGSTLLNDVIINSDSSVLREAIVDSVAFVYKSNLRFHQDKPSSYTAWQKLTDPQKDTHPWPEKLLIRYSIIPAKAPPTGKIRYNPDLLSTEKYWYPKKSMLLERNDYTDPIRAKISAGCANGKVEGFELFADSLFFWRISSYMDNAPDIGKAKPVADVDLYNYYSKHKDLFTRWQGLQLQIAGVPYSNLPASYDRREWYDNHPIGKLMDHFQVYHLSDPNGDRYELAQKIASWLYSSTNKAWLSILLTAQKPDDAEATFIASRLPDGDQVGIIPARDGWWVVRAQAENGTEFNAAQIEGGRKLDREHVSREIAGGAFSSIHRRDNNSRIFWQPRPRLADGAEFIRNKVIPDSIAAALNNMNKGRSLVWAGPDSLYIIKVVQVAQASVPEYESIKDQVVARWPLQARRQRCLVLLSGLQKALKNGAGPMDMPGFVRRCEVLLGIKFNSAPATLPNSRQVLLSAFCEEAGFVSQPVEVEPGVWLVYRLDGVTKVKRSDFEEQKDDYMRTFRQRSLKRVLKQLESEYGVKRFN